MIDTTPEIEQLYRERLMALDPSDRGARMFDAARTLVLASFPPDLTPAELRLRLLQRFYPEIDTESVRAAIRQHAY